MARNLQLWTEASRATKGFSIDPVEVGKAFQVVESKLDRAKGFSYLLAQFLFPIVIQAGLAVRQLEANRAVQIALVEAATTRARTGAWPIRTTIRDPFTGGPLKVKVSGAGFRVYSVGKDGKDDGGIALREVKGRKTTDVVAAIPIPVRR